MRTSCTCPCASIELIHKHSRTTTLWPGYFTFSWQPSCLGYTCRQLCNMSCKSTGSNRDAATEIFVFKQSLLCRLFMPSWSTQLKSCSKWFAYRLFVLLPWHHQHDQWHQSGWLCIVFIFDILLESLLIIVIERVCHWISTHLYFIISTIL